MALMGVGSNYLSQLPNESIPDSKMENTGKDITCYSNFRWFYWHNFWNVSF